MMTFLVAGFAVAGEAKAETVTVEGKVMCAKCVLHDEGREKCQNVLAVEKGEKVLHYYLSGDINAEFGDVCMATPSVRATGTVTEKDGHMWLAATKIEKVEG
jgi:hypothetical protein